jgi:class I fructose-bisphosphate aldolase/fructose-bisphosphate aldolase/2-amino-3,7-dideoxy-D-threo-hept-6-ulosonate synthase
MCNIGKILRLGHIVKDDNRTLIVALDHGFMGIIQGLEDIEKVISKVIAGGADAIMSCSNSSDGRA